MDLSTLEPGDPLVDRDIVITASMADAYTRAVGDECALYAEEGLVPPMAVAALVMAEAMEAVSLPAGTVHTGQELTFSRPVTVDSAVRCSATVAANSVRRGTRFLTLDLRGELDGQPAVEGRAALAVPEADG
ncbi:MAG: MaoC family dehydratase [Chloroflexota bacterium]|nr:MaoC family dehydratase [Chloroflexota bacterium]MDE2884338.1 MaoC family dehydratase [Chloroflexota bacterium]